MNWTLSQDLLRRPSSKPSQTKGSFSRFPVWTAFEKVHISLNPTDVLIARESKPVTTPISKTVASAAPTTAPSQPKMAEADQKKAPESKSDQWYLQVNEL